MPLDRCSSLGVCEVRVGGGGEEVGPAPQANVTRCSVVTPELATSTG